MTITMLVALWKFVITVDKATFFNLSRSSTKKMGLETYFGKDDPRIALSKSTKLELQIGGAIFNPSSL